MALFIDLYPLSQQATDDALEFIFKSAHDRDNGIWSLHESILIRRLIELFTQRGLDRLEAVKNKIIAWQSGIAPSGSQAPPVPPGMMGRWTQSELELVKIYLESLPPGTWSIGDHMMAVDYVVQRYLPLDDLVTEAEWMATRAGLMGKVQANIDAKKVTSKVADKILAALPSTVAQAATQFNLSAQQKWTLEFAKVRAAENVRALSESVRHRMRSVVLNHLESQQAGKANSSLQTVLLDEFATLNRDWRRIAVTEAGDAQLQGYIASLKPGTKVQRIEQYENACGHCRKIHGKIMEVVDPSAPNKDGDTQVWVGKNNIGRSASPRKRIGSTLVHREPDELWWIAAGTQHPHCRGRWVPVIEDQPGDDPEFGDWLRATLAS